MFQFLIGRLKTVNTLIDEVSQIEVSIPYR